MMSRKMKRVGMAVLGVGLVASLAGCPPPFNATGTYEGTWSAEIAGAPVECPLTLTLTQGGPFVVGTATFNYSCFLPQALIDALSLTDLTVPVAGMLKPNGNLKLTLDTSAFSPPVPFTMVITFDGAGEDADADGTMDTFAGDMSFTWTIQTDLPGLAPEVTVDVAGEFDVAL